MDEPGGPGGTPRTRGRLLYPEGHPRAHLGSLLLVLTFASGLVDAVSFFGLGHVFVANMTGNVVFLGFALAGFGELSAPASAAALASFLLGAAAAGRRRAGPAGARLLARLVALQALLTAAALIVLACGGGRYPVLVPLAAGMGLQNAVVLRLGLPDLTTTVVTRTLTGLAVDPWGAAGRRRLLSVAVLFLGALVGGLLYAGPGSAWALAAVLALLCAVAVVPFRHGPDPPAPPTP
ncbi:YoaK family protein [Streptomyces sp. NPDC097619]|uniref:YoaK family protein n=1 Tax=Streptomyces sp. NPDC097619 TaxID=3157228 RepID=UPI00331B9789